MRGECWWEGARRAAGERAEGARKPRQRAAGGRDSNGWAIGVAEELRTGGRELARNSGLLATYAM